ALVVTGSGAGAGTKDFPDRPNITRVVLGEPVRAAARSATTEQLVILEANVDDLDPRLWPGVLDSLLRAGAADAWLVPIVMKKGRPAHILTALCRPDLVADLQQLIVDRTTTLGVRRTPVSRSPLSRGWVELEVAGQPLSIKVGYDASGLRQVNPEFDDVVAAAAATQQSEREVLDLARTAARAAGLEVGAVPPAELSDRRSTR
ncbi:MAG TPA: nickel insertion protein, partial [Microlunatus sp.]|nr:nickel insertion protein [Microlunatus sp.]